MKTSVAKGDTVRLTDDTEMKLDEADFAAEMSAVRYTHEEVFGRLKSRYR